MNEMWVIDLAKSSLSTMLLVSAPLLMTALIVGLLVSIFQALTQISEATLTFIPKILAMCGAILLLGPWMLRILANFTTQLYEHIPSHVR